MLNYTGAVPVNGVCTELEKLLAQTECTVNLWEQILE